MKVCVKAWQKVIDLATGKVHDKVGASCLGCNSIRPSERSKRIDR